MDNHESEKKNKQKKEKRKKKKVVSEIDFKKEKKQMFQQKKNLQMIFWNEIYQLNKQHLFFFWYISLRVQEYMVIETIHVVPIVQNHS
tara:strand:+ start:852 stop:1115 length:264 start_codon:yes stop_codon:yes gene_type:complete